MSAKKKSEKKKEAVLLVGSGYGGLKVAEDLAQSGIPVVWVTGARHFLELPGGVGTFSEWPEDINFQFRPLYLRVTRHPLVTPLTRARIERLERKQDGFHAVVVQNPHYIDYDLCIGCSRCMEVCPLNDTDHPPLTRTPAYCPSRALDLDKRQLGACRVGCPLGVNIQAYMALTAAGRFDEALHVIREDNPLPGICGRVCHHPCEESCRRSELDQAVAIRDIKRFLTDYEAESGPAQLDMAERKARPEKVAVIGSGPAGLTAAHFLNRAGFKATIFEALPEAGGMLRSGINAFRLPRRVLDAEIRAIVNAGTEIRTGVSVDSLDKLWNEGFRAILLCTGTHRDLRLNIPGEDLDGVVHCVEFLSGVNLYGTGEVGARTVVIGAGNSAMDAARTALRLGAEEVTILAIEKEDEMPAHPREVREAREEGVAFKLGAAPIAFEGNDRKVGTIICRPAHWSRPDPNGPPRIEYDSDETFSLKADTVIVSIGQRPHLEGTGLGDTLKTDRGGRIVVDKSLSASLKGVFAAGDVVTGPSSVIDSMASGRRAAGRIIEYLSGEPSPFSDLSADSRGVGDYRTISEDIPRQWRPEMAQRQPKARRRDFDEVDFGFTSEQALAESRRCLQCSACCECRACETACTGIGAIDHFRPPARFAITSPGVVVVDPDELEGIDISKDDRIHRICDLKTGFDLVDQLVAGSAAAGQAMAEAASLRSLAFRADSAALDPVDEGRLGFFVCNCNGAMAPAGVVERIREMAARIPSVAHSETIFSVCHPKGADHIAEAVRRNRLGRVILASCVCCPLEFQCISCNDQRNRARIHLFDRLGLPRSHFEMINIRDHLGVEEQSEDEFFERARYLLRSAFLRAEHMRPLRQGVTEIGKNILVLGGSEIGVSCALNLAHQGFRVRLVHRCNLVDDVMPESIRKRPVKKSGSRSITHVQEAVIEEIDGHVGDFRVTLTVDGERRHWKADAICLTDENILPLAIPDDRVGLKKLYRYNFAFFHTPQLGFYRVMPRTLKRVSAFEAGTALAAQVATATAEAFLKDHELSPRVDPDRCRGCGRCRDICPFDAIKMVPADHGTYTSEVVRHNCVGCGGCVGRCPVTAMDIPYFSNQLLIEILEDTLAGDELKWNR